MEELLFTIVELVEVMDAAREELVFVKFEDIVSTFEARDELASVSVRLVLEIEDASDELVVFIELCSPSILSAALELFVVTVLLKLVTDEFNEAEES
jgi:hypothetical protein